MVRDSIARLFASLIPKLDMQSFIMTAHHLVSPLDYSNTRISNHLTPLRLLVDIRFQVLFHSPPGVLFTFPSRYYALSVAKSILPWRVVPPASHKVSRVSWYSGYQPFDMIFRLRGYYSLWLTFPGNSTRTSQIYAGPQPRPSKLDRFGLIPVRSPLLRESRLITLPLGT